MDKKIGVIEVSGEVAQLLALGAESMFMLAEEMAGDIGDQVQPEVMGIIIGSAFAQGAFGGDKDRQQRFGDAFAATMHGKFSGSEAAQNYRDSIKKLLGGA
jgi:hypothetical protein